MNQFETKSFVKGAITLAVAGFIVKVLSAVYRVPYQNLTGDTGFFIYQQIYPIYYFAVFLGLYGFSAAYSKLLSETKENERYNVSKTIFYLQGLIGFILFLLIYSGSAMLAVGLGNTRFEPIIKGLSLLYLLVPFLSFLRGYFQGMGDMKTSSTSQIIEQLFRVVGIMIGLYFFTKGTFSLYETANFAYVGTLISVLGTTLVLVFFVNQRKISQLFLFIKNGSFSFRVAKRYCKVLFYLLLSSCLTVSLQLIDNFTIINIIYYNHLTEWSSLYEMKGVFDRAQPFIQVGLVVSTAFSLSVLPYISKTNMKESLHYTNISFKWSVLIGGAAAVGLCAIMPELNRVLFEDGDGTLVIALQCLVVIFLTYLITGLFILQAFYYQRATAIIVIFALVLKIAGNILLIPYFGFYGAVLSSLISLAIVSYFLHVYAKKKFSNTYLGISLSSFVSLMLILFFITRILMEMVMYILPSVYNSRLLLCGIVIVVVLIVAILYFSLLVKKKVVTQKELLYIPFGSHIYKWFAKE